MPSFGKTAPPPAAKAPVDGKQKPGQTTRALPHRGAMGAAKARIESAIS